VAKPVARDGSISTAVASRSISPAFDSFSSVEERQRARRFVGEFDTRLVDRHLESGRATLTNAQIAS
jgi:hypothetical protein